MEKEKEGNQTLDTDEESCPTRDWRGPWGG